MKLLFSRGTLTLTLSLTFAFAASAAINERGRGRDLLIDEEEEMNMPKFKPYNSGSIKTLIVSYRDDAAHDKVAAHTTAMASQGRAIMEDSNIKFAKRHNVRDKAQRARGLQDDQGDRADDFVKGFSFVKVDTTSENFEAEVAALKNIEGVLSVQEDTLVHILSMEHQQNLRGVKAADHISEIQDAMKAATEALPVPEDDIDYSPNREGRGRRLAENLPYGIDMVNASWVWDQDPPADPIKICVVDTGYDSGHPDLPKEVEHNVKGWHAGIGTSSTPYGKWNVDGHGHGTHCAGTIGAIGDNGIGVTSVNPDPSKFQFIITKGLSDGGSGTTANVVSAVEQCVIKGAKVVSMSLGGSGYNPEINAFYEEMYDGGVLIIAAAGNDGDSGKSYPASYPAVMSVGSVTSAGVHSWFSQYNDQVEIAAPGSGVESTWKNNQYKTISGTSMATPHVAGVAALLWSHFPDCTNNQIRNAMIHSTASDGWNSKYGWGIVNAGHAYELLKTGCETAGGVGTPPNGQQLSDIANGGKDQKNEGCTIDAHCDQSNFCYTETSECVAAPPAPTPAPGAPCPSGQTKYQVTVTADNYPSETSYTLKNLCSNETILEGSNDEFDAGVDHVSVVCAAAERMQFVIKDSHGDGICCNYGPGSYEVTEGGEVVASGGQFGSEDDTTFGWDDCGNPPPIAPPSNPPTTAAPAPTNPPQTTSAPTTSPTVVPTSPPTTLPTVVPTSPPTAAPTNTNAPTPNPTVPVTLPPTSGDNAVAQEAVYDTTLSVPRCANTGSSCDSLSLLNGKGDMVNGQEPNASNTNKFGPVCNDGNSGSYHSDESIDQITVTAGDLDASGNPSPSGDFIVEGGRAYVTVKLWCWGTGASDHADLFLSSTASSPDWQLLTTITCPGGGAQTIRHAFDVPSGNDQSIRVNFRYRGTVSKCSNGGYDDHDDLVFAVKSSGTSAPTPSPPPGGPSGPQTATFDESLEAPKCSYGSRCDSVDLLDGRAFIKNGNEPNTPNTVNVCSDGTYGTYHSDESIDKIVVSRVDGGSGDFTEGDEVTITATVYCWSSGSSDYIDFYYAQNANSPAWMTIGARETCPGGQVQTVSRNLVLQSAGLQAVRVNLMFGNGNAGTNKCTSGHYDDTDDLVISVRPNAMASTITSGKDKDKKDDEVQGAIVEVQHDKRADDAAAALVQLNGSIRPADVEDESSSSKKSKKGKADKEAVVSANAVSATSKYVCGKHEPLNAVICDKGDEKDDKCSYHGQSCGKKGKQKQCYFAECADYEGTD